MIPALLSRPPRPPTPAFTPCNSCLCHLLLLIRAAPFTAPPLLTDGQTGTGKTHTMTGDIADELSAGAGVIPRAIHQIFGYLDGIASEYSVKCSYLELYNEEITDLLTIGADVPKVVG